MMQPLPHNLGQLWAASGLCSSTNIALRYAAGATSFAELDQAANALAAFALASGIRQGDVVAIGHEKRPLAYAMMLACLKIGAPYVILDCASPLARLNKILVTAQPRLLVYDAPATAENMDALAQQNGLRAQLLTDALLAKYQGAPLPPLNAVDGATIAYIMFTSGSTGEPKGVAARHSSLLRFNNWGRQRFAVTAADVFAQASPMYFDNSVFDFYAGLFSGACLAPIERKLLTAPYDLARHVADMACTLWFSVPSLLIYLLTMKALKPAALPALRAIAFGGEGYPKPELKKLYELFAPQARIVNVYGPTECTCICSSYDLSAADFQDCAGLPPLGRLNHDFGFQIANPDQNGAGELVLLGEQVASGYFNDPERSKSAFFIAEDPRFYGQRAYRTGDIVREEDGIFYFLGRKDNQIKHMGYRIELEEIEHAIARLPNVSRAAAIYQRQNDAFGKILAFAAYDGEADERALLRQLAEYLPAYMIPSRLTLLPDLPKNANGKVDRQALKERAAS